MVEVLERLDLLSGTGSLIAVDDGPITTIKNTPITVNILANDTFDAANVPVITLIPGPNSYATLNADNSVTFTPLTGFVGQDTASYSISDGTQSATANILINISPTPEELYAAYQLQVSAADQAFADAVADAVNARQTSIEAAAGQLYSAYLADVSDAWGAYVEAHFTAEGAYQDGLLPLEASLNARAEASISPYQSNLATALADVSQAAQNAQQNYTSSIQAGEEAYAGALAPYEAALDAALGNAANNPDVQDAQAAIAQAEQALTQAEAQAVSARDAAYATALSELESARGAATGNYLFVLNSVRSAVQPDLAAAHQEFETAESALWIEVEPAEIGAQQAFLQGEHDAWNAYLAALAGLNEEDQGGQTAAQSQFTQAVSAAFENWNGAEQAAWTDYATAVAAIPGAPPLGARRTEPNFAANTQPPTPVVAMPRGAAPEFISIPRPGTFERTQEEFRRTLEQHARSQFVPTAQYVVDATFLLDEGLSPDEIRAALGILPLEGASGAPPRIEQIPYQSMLEFPRMYDDAANGRQAAQLAASFIQVELPLQYGRTVLNLALTFPPGRAVSWLARGIGGGYRFIRQGARYVVMRRQGAQLVELTAQETTQFVEQLLSWTTGRQLQQTASNVFRGQARAMWVRTAGAASIAGREAHHRIPLRFAHLFPNTYPNNATNLYAVTPSNHGTITRAWERWAAQLGREATAAEVTQQAALIDQQFGALMEAFPAPR